MGLVSELKRLVNRNAPIDLKRLRAAKPVRNPAVVEIDRAEDGTLTLEAPLEMQGKGFTAALAKWARVPTTKRFELEGVGAFVWNLCDGQHTVEGIARRLKEHYKMNRIEAEASLNAFLQMLTERRLITMLMVTPKK